MNTITEFILFLRRYIFINDYKKYRLAEISHAFYRYLSFCPYCNKRMTTLINGHDYVGIEKNINYATTRKKIKQISNNIIAPDVRAVGFICTNKQCSSNKKTYIKVNHGKNIPLPQPPSSLINNNLW